MAGRDTVYIATQSAVLTGDNNYARLSSNNAMYRQRYVVVLCLFPVIQDHLLNTIHNSDSEYTIRTRNSCRR